MKRYLLLLALPAAACHPDQPVAADSPATPAAPASQAFAPPTGRLRSGDSVPATDHDTLRVPGGVLYLKPSTAAAFERAPTELDWEADKRLPSTGRVRRVGNDLLLQPERGP